MGTYNLIQDFGLKEGDLAEISYSSYWILMVLRYTDPLTSSKARIANRTVYHTGDISFDDDMTRLNKTKSPLIITDDCISLDVDSNKGRYTHNLQAVLAPGGRDYLSAIMPGDWVFAWMMNSETTYLNVLEKLRQQQPANEFGDGLKFVGKVQDIREVLSQGQGGLRTLQYNLQAVGFGELDSSVFFDPNLSRNEKYIERILQHLSIPMAEIYNMAAEEAQKAGGIDINKVIPALIKAFIGEGIRGIGVKSGGLDLAQGAAIATEDAPFAYVVPEGVAEILGVRVPSKSSGIFSYADILETIQGLQKYEDTEFPRLFFPAGVFSMEQDQVVTPNRHFTRYPLKGLFMPTPIAFDNKTVWNLLSEYLNPVINEMYTAVKLTPSGRVMPTLVIRQLPFSSPVLTDKLKEKVTAFHELPRWKAEPVLVRVADIGRSDGERINFVHIYGQSTKQTRAVGQGQQLVLFPPVADPQDQKRHGLRPNQGMAPVAPTDIIGGGPAEWMGLRADFLMGQHLMLTGICSLAGITSPIVPGDNFEFRDTLFHIESVHHHCEISGNGIKSFTTQVSLSHGVRSDVPTATARIPPKKKVRKKARIREDLVASGNEAVTFWARKGKDADYMRRQLAASGGSLDDLDRAYWDSVEGEEVEALEDGTNPDLYLYSGVHEDDDSSCDPGLTKDVEE